MTVDHIEPKSKGGARSPVKNGAAACWSCNQAKADTGLLEFLGQRAGLWGQPAAPEPEPRTVLVLRSTDDDPWPSSEWSMSKHVGRVLARQPMIDRRWLRRMRRFMERHAPIRVHVSAASHWVGTWLFLHPSSISRKLFVSARCIECEGFRKYRIEALGWVDDAWCEQRDIKPHAAVQLN